MNWAEKSSLVAIIITIVTVISLVMYMVHIENSTQKIILTNPETGNHLFEVLPNKKYIQIRIINNKIGTFTVSLSLEIQK